MQTVECHKCSKKFSATYKSLADAHLQRHLTRKNTCTKPFPPIAHDMSVIDIDFEGDTLSSALFQIFDKYNCVCLHDVSYDNIFYYIDGQVHSSSLAQFIYDIWFDFLIPRIFPILKERGWSFEKHGFSCDVTSNNLKRSKSLGRYKGSEYFTSDFYMYVEQNPFYPKFKKKLYDYLSNVPKQKRAEIRKVILSPKGQQET